MYLFLWDEQVIYDILTAESENKDHKIGQELKVT